MIILVVIIIVLCIVIGDKNSQIRDLQKNIRILEKKINVLKQSLQNGTELATQKKEKVLQTETVAKVNSNVSINNRPVISEEEKKKKLLELEKKKSEMRNNAILTVGAFFIVIAAISFLYSTWHTVPDLIKSSVILILAGVFFGISKIAEKVFKLNKTANAFFYISMAYIPLCLFSISLFGLAGKYLSITGEGKFIYLSIASFLVMWIYSFFAHKNKDEKLYFSSCFMQLILVICLGGILTTEWIEILCIMLIYTVILNLVNGKFEKDFSVQGQKYRIILACTISAISSIVALLLPNNAFVELTLALGSTMNFAILYMQNNKKEFYAIAYVIGFLAFVEVISLELLALSFNIKQIVIVAAIAISVYYHNFIKNNEEISKIMNWINTSFMFLLYFFTISVIEKESIIDLFILGCIGNLISTAVYVKNNNQVELFATSMIANSIIILLPDNLYSDISFASYILCAISSIAMLLVLHKDERIYLKIIPIITFFINLYRYEFVIGEIFDFTFIINIASIVALGYLAIKDKNDIIYRASSLVFLIGLFAYSQMDLYVASLILILWALIQAINTDGDIKKAMHAIMISSLVLMYLLMISEADVTALAYIIGIIESLICWLVFSRTKYLKALPILGIMIPLYSYDLLLFDKFNITVLLNVAIVIGFAFVALKNKEDIVYRFSSLIYLIGLFAYTEMDLYVASLILIIWALIQAINTEGNIKKSMKAIMIGSLSLMYLMMFIEALLNDITTSSYVISIIESSICWFVFSRTKYLKALPILGFMIPLYGYDLMLLGKYDITFLLNIALVAGFTYLSITGKKENVYKLVSFIYLLGLVFKYYEINIYIRLLLVIIWGVCQLMHTEGIIKDVIKALIATCSLGIYMNVLFDLEMMEITAFKLLGFLIYFHVITRCILKNYMEEEYKIFEYLITTIIYLCAFSMYRDGVDIAIFVVMQVIILMVAYINKFGPAFAITLPAIVINTIYLTRNFWLGIPWWVYLVAVGGVLIVFAARNELSEKKDMQSVKEKLEKVREFLDM